MPAYIGVVAYQLLHAKSGFIIKKCAEGKTISCSKIVQMNDYIQIERINNKVFETMLELKSAMKSSNFSLY